MGIFVRILTINARLFCAGFLTPVIRTADVLKAGFQISGCDRTLVIRRHFSERFDGIGDSTLAFIRSN